MQPAAQQTATIEMLSRRLRAPLRRFFEKRIGRSAEVDDLVQEVFVRLSACTNLDLVNRFEPYLFQTAANLLRDRGRRLAARAAGAHVPYEEPLHGGAAAAFDPERTILGLEAIEQLVSALYELPERTRCVFALYHFEDLPHAQIALRLGMAQSTVEKHMSRASAHLLKRTERNA